MKKQPLNVRLLFSVGLLLVTLPPLIGEYVPIPDFFRGFLVGIGIVLEIGGIIKMKQNQRTNALR